MDTNTDRLIAALTGECPCCGVKAKITYDQEDKDITHIFFEHESWCDICPADAGPPKIQ